MAEEKNSKQLLEVAVYRLPYEVLYQGKAEAVSSENKVGKFSILPFHANFITLIQNQLTIHSGKKPISYQINRGVLEVSENKVTVYLGI